MEPQTSHTTYELVYLSNQETVFGFNVYFSSVIAVLQNLITLPWKDGKS